MQKKNREEKKKRKEAHLPGPPRPNLPLRSPAAGPAHLPFCRLPPCAPKQLGVKPERAEDATATPTRFQASPAHQSAPRRRTPRSLSPLSLSPPSRALCASLLTDTERSRRYSSPEIVATVSYRSNQDVYRAHRHRFRRLAEGDALIRTRRDASFNKNSPDPRAHRRRFAAVGASPTSPPPQLDSR